MTTTNPNYSIPYPYTATIILLILINVVFLIRYRDNINWKKYLAVQFFCTLFGSAQIHGLENIGNVPGWFFPVGSAYFQDIGVVVYKHFVLEDLFFIPCCSGLFYSMLYLTRNVKDYLKNKKILIGLFSTFLIVEALVYQVGGLGCRILMIPYTLGPILVLIIIGFNFKKINITHALINLGFCFLINCGWELFNAWRMHWVYNQTCDLFGASGWILGGKLHLSIFIQFAISGFVVMYFSWLFFDRDDVY